MASVRAMFVLVTILSFATPSISWSAANELSPLTASTMSLAAPSSGSQLVRAFAKADKTFSAGLATPVASQPLFQPSYSTDGHSTGSPDLPNLDLSGPPLAPRPPPAR